MPVKVVCPNTDCSGSSAIEPDLIGQRILCEKCGEIFEAVGETSDRVVIDQYDSETPLLKPISSSDLPSSFGKYNIIRKLGHGGMGTVYLALDVKLDRLVALKVPHFDRGADPSVIERFHREAKAAAQFDHPNFCSIYDFGQVGEMYYLAMKFIEGQTLASRIARDEQMPAKEAARIGRELALALAEAHRRGIIHRDLKPANIMVDPSGTLIIMDFGVAQRVGGEEADLTQSGVLMGTPYYMSPEQIDKTKYPLGPATDIYSLGVMLYELSTGRRPHEGPVLSVIGAILHVEPKPPSEIRPGLDAGFEAICLKAMAKSINARYGSMDMLAAALNDYSQTIEASSTTKKADVDSNDRSHSWEANTKLNKKLLGYDAAILLAPNDAKAYYNRGVFWHTLGDMARAMDDYDKATRLDPKDASAYNNRGNCWKAKGDMARAMADYDKAIRLDPEEASAYNNRGNCWHTMGDMARAMADYDKAIRLDPKDASAYNNRGNCWKAKGNMARAMADYDKAIRRDPKYAKAYYNRGLYWKAKGDIAKAMADYDEAIRLNPKDAQAYNVRGLCWHEEGDIVKAIADYDEAIRLDPKYAKAYYNRANCRKATGDNSKAITDYDEAIRLDPKYAKTYNNRGLCWHEEGDIAKAMADYDEAIRLNPKDAQAYGNLAWILASCPDAKYRHGNRAVRIALKACELESWKDVGKLATLAASHAEAGEFHEAVRRQQEAIDLATDRWKEIYCSRLKLYEAKQPYRAKSMKTQPKSGP